MHPDEQRRHYSHGAQDAQLVLHTASRLFDRPLDRLFDLGASMTKDEALLLALDWLEKIAYVTAMDYEYQRWAREAITAIKEALAQPEQPKVRTGDCLLVGVCASEGHKIAPQRTWVGLTNDEVNNFAAGCHLGNSVQGAIYKAEAKLRNKNETN
jgi:hypothetical protein